MKTLLTIVIVTLLVACNSAKSPNKPTDNQGIITIICGDRDAHGCIDSTGYVWSELRQDCIRIWESGVRMILVADTSKAGYAVFSHDSLCVELFLPDIKVHEILERRRDMGQWVWDIEDDGSILLRRKNDAWQLVQGDKVIFFQRE